MIVCKNDKNKKYKGNENSPLGLGYCSSAEKTETVMKGLDGNEWKVIETKNGYKRWIKLKKTDNFSLENFYDIPKIIDSNDLDLIIKKESKNIINIFKILNDSIIPEIKKLNKYTNIVPIPISNNDIYWSDYPDSYLNNINSNTDWQDNYIYFGVYLDCNYKINKTKYISIMYSQLNLEEKKNLINIFYKYLPNNYEWNGNNNKIMMINLKKRKIKKININDLKSNDNYPYLYIFIKLEKFDHINLNILEVEDINSLFKSLEKINGHIDYSYSDEDLTFEIRGGTHVKSNIKKIINLLNQLILDSPPIMNVVSFKIYFNENEGVLNYNKNNSFNIKINNFLENFK